ncbi:MAG: 16S rRNA (guanine(527)-N(7))-methyltransferase RsmG [Candidatus Dormibacteraeota bacterium]|nr:16S rRNA (guanine(527)-N(7))-methyltransferase RsmG [Candidatus Dormibacteraeota bacterium]MBO0760659.1 16S rRNA (guanine(527)-N(7))-methyltransferase RsmG [Candidatus Dormibacteraeota bacterium]
METRLGEFERLLVSWPGLVSARAREDVTELVRDSLALLDHLGGAGSVVDVGSGGGMPGIPLQLARPDLRVTLLESDRRKAAFLVHAAASLDLTVEVVAERAEDAGRGPLREAFDVAVSRALGPMPVVAELCLPLVRTGGRLLAMAGQVEPFGEAARLVGGGEPEVLPAPTGARSSGRVLAVPKVAPTPDRYPRRAGVPQRSPL